MTEITLEELKRIADSTPGMSAKEWEELCHSCPEWVAREEKREREHQERFALSREASKPLIADLRSAGFDVDGISYFVNTAERYPDAIPILTKHLQLTYPFNIREGIIRSLTVPEARGEPARVMLEEYRNSGNERGHVRWAMVNALDVIADVSLVEDMEALLAEERDNAVARILKLAIVKAKKRAAPG